MQTLKWLPRPKYNYSGVVFSFKGDSTAQAAEVSGAHFDELLMQTFQKQYGQQQGIINYLKQLMEPVTSKGGQGYSPADLAAQRTAAKDTIATEFKNAQAGVNAAAVRTGGADLPSSVSTLIESSLAPQQALAESQAENAITTANANLKQQNYWNAINVLNGQSAALNPLGYAELPISGGNTVANLSNSVTAAKGPSVGQILGGLVGGAATSFLGGFGANPKIFG